MLAAGEGGCTNVTSQLLRHVYVAGQRYSPLVGHENMYMCSNEATSLEKVCDGGISVEQREINDWGLVEICKGGETCGLGDYIRKNILKKICRKQRSLINYPH